MNGNTLTKTPQKKRKKSDKAASQENLETPEPLDCDEVDDTSQQMLLAEKFGMPGGDNANDQDVLPITEDDPIALDPPDEEADTQFVRLFRDEDADVPQGPSPKKMTREEQTALLEKRNEQNLARNKAGKKANPQICKIVASIRDGIRTCQCADSNIRVIITFKLLLICECLKKLRQIQWKRTVLMKYNIIEFQPN